MVLLLLRPIPLSVPSAGVDAAMLALSAFLAALSRTPGHCAGTFISHLAWQV